LCSVRCFKQIWKVDKVGKVGKLGKVGCVSSSCHFSTRFYISLTKMVKKEMNNFVVKVWKKFDLDSDLVCYAKIFLQIYTAIP
jgi:hypothetical protein